jgi:hypothetical protein
VLVVDAVDSASIVGVNVGADLKVRYDPASPRDARLTIGSRTFIEKNRYHFRVSVIGVPDPRHPGRLGLALSTD